MTRHGPLESEFDYVVVGGGASGLPLAVRLAEAGNFRVAVVEAGLSDLVYPAVADIRAYASLLGTSCDFDFPVVTEPGGNDRLRYNAGRVLGGGSSINSAAAMSLPDADMIRWEAAAGPSWGIEAMSPARERVMGAVAPKPGEPLHPLSEAFIDAAAACGFSRSSPGGREFVRGVGKLPLAAWGSRRRSSAAAYLRGSDSAKPTPTLFLGRQAQRVLFDSGTAATGVILDDQSVLRAEREVILCAGALQTPKLLMLSGIGPAEHLRTHGVRVLVDSPEIGNGLVDHPDVPVIWKTLAPPGPSATHGWETVLIADSGMGDGLPDLVINFATLPYDLHTAPHGYPTAPDAVSMSAFLCRPASRGSVRLRNGDAAAAPLIMPRFFTDAQDHDRAVLARAIEIMRAVANAEPLRPQLDRELCPGLAMATGAELLAYVRTTSGSMLHPAGTCAAGRSERSVLDPELRVRGTDRLRVADASAFPDTVSVNTCLAAMIVGERAAEMLLRADALPKMEEWR